MSDNTSTPTPSKLEKIEWDKIFFEIYQKIAPRGSGHIFCLSRQPSTYLFLHRRHLRLESPDGALACYVLAVGVLLAGAMLSAVTIFMVTSLSIIAGLAGVLLHRRTRSRNRLSIERVENIAKRIKHGEDVFDVLLSYREMREALMDLETHTRGKLHALALGHHRVVTIHTCNLNVQSDPRLPGVISWQTCWIANKDAILHALQTAYTVVNEADVLPETIHEAYLRLAKVYRMLLEHETLHTPSADS